MRRCMPGLTVLLLWVGAVPAQGILLPRDRAIPPLTMVEHKVRIQIEEQASVTRIEQVFKNPSNRPVEATYHFPLPRGASVSKFTMFLDGREVAGELVEAAKARQIYQDIVRRTQDPGLLEYLGNDMLQMRVFPIPAHGEQRVALSYSALSNKDAGLIEYLYPLKTDGKMSRTLRDFSIVATLRSQSPIHNVYSPTHAITVRRPSDREVNVEFEKNQGLLDKDFQMFYAIGDKDFGCTVVPHRPLSGEKGYFLLLLSPPVERVREQAVPRDMVFVLDTSGSMRGAKMDQARRALKYCLSNLGEKDRFGVLNFATAVTKYRDNLLEASRENLDAARKWVDGLESTGGTAINDALASAFDMRSTDSSRTFTIIFFTDGLPTVGETNAEKILRNVANRNTSNTRIFPFGVGDDVNATMLDNLAEQTRAVSTYVRPSEDIEAKVSGLYSKISHPVLANLRIKTGGNVHLEEMYPPQLPDLFHGGQIVVLGRYSGDGHPAITLTGNSAGSTREFTYEVAFPSKTHEDRTFIEHLWARRKVGYLLDQIRANGEKRELVDEIVLLAKKYGIATPYTSYLIVPDGPVPTYRYRGAETFRYEQLRLGVEGTELPRSLAPASPGGAPEKVLELARKASGDAEKVAGLRNKAEDDRLAKLPTPAPGIAIGGGAGGPGAAGGLGAATNPTRQLQETKMAKESLDQARQHLFSKQQAATQSGKLGVDLSVQSNQLRNQTNLTQSALRNVAGRNCLEVGGVWIDEGYDAKMPVATVKAQSEAYFRILERHPKVKEAFQLGNYLVWVTPNKTALVVDANDGKEKLSDAEIDALFAVAKK